MLKSIRSALLVGFAGASAVTMTACSSLNTISSDVALQKASQAFVCPPGLVVAFESKESNLNKIQSAMPTSNKMFNDVDCAREAKLGDKMGDIKALLPFIGTEINNGIVLQGGQPRAIKYKDPSGKFSFEPIRIKADPELDAYFKAQGFQTESGHATKNYLGQKWNLNDAKGVDFVRAQYKKDGLTPPVLR